MACRHFYMRFIELHLFDQTLSIDFHFAESEPLFAQIFE